LPRRAKQAAAFWCVRAGGGIGESFRVVITHWTAAASMANAHLKVVLCVETPKIVADFGLLIHDFLG
jgi:hypothetical protein